MSRFKIAFTVKFGRHIWTFTVSKGNRYLVSIIRLVVDDTVWKLFVFVII